MLCVGAELSHPMCPYAGAHGCANAMLIRLREVLCLLEPLLITERADGFAHDRGDGNGGAGHLPPPYSMGSAGKKEQS